jgi:hypothetical protein
MLCPHCQKDIHFGSSGSFFFYERGQPSKDHWIWDTTGPRTVFSGGYCPSCRGKIVVELYWDSMHESGGPVPPEFSQGKFVSIVYPRRHSLRPLPLEVPPDYRMNYDEACLVLADSPKASAALSRRLLQRVFHEHFGIKKKDLFQEIDEYINTKTPPSDLADQLHAVRHVGAMAAHPLKELAAGTIVDVEPGEAEWLLELIAALLDEVFVRAARDAARKANLNAKLSGVGKTPMT